MKRARIIIVSLVATLLVCAIFAPSVIQHGGRGIACGYQSDPGGPRVMQAGDHLQLLYHFWLLGDSLWGETPLFRNPYEFNSGVEGDDPKLGGAYYAPFGPVFALLYPLAGRAAAWNLTGFLSLWVGYLAMFLLLRRYLASSWIAALGALPTLLLPYRWLALLGGSPTGFAMMWPPVIMLGLDVALRDRRLSGAWMAGLALLLSKWSDTHVFFFSFLAVPFWCLISLVKSLSDSPTPEEKRLGHPGLVLASRGMRLWPVALCMGIAWVATALITESLAGSGMDHGRDIREVLIFSPVFKGIFSWNTLSGHDFQVYLGRVLPVVIAAGLALLLTDRVRKRPESGVELGLFLLLLAAVTAVALLSLGPRLPLDPNHAVFRLLRRLVPPYRMIRQTAKIYAIMPPLLALLFGMALSRLRHLPLRKNLRVWLMAGIALAAVGDYARRIRPAICLLDADQGAYEAVALDADARGEERRALALPLWPGDSHWGSLYQHYASLYRIRMINGYSPVVAKKYIQGVFKDFSPMNSGYFDAESLDDLLSRKIDYILLHEDAFPEKVSPFPVVQTLSAMRRHPRLRFLKRDAAVWAFRILAEPDTNDPREIPGSEFYFPARLWFAAFSAPGGAETAEGGDDVSRGRYLRVQGEDMPFLTPSQPVRFYPALRYLARVRGEGDVRARIQVEEDASAETFHAASTPQPPSELVFSAPASWQWIEMKVPSFEGYRAARLELSATSPGFLEIDMVVLSAGRWDRLEIGERMILPAAAFFRAGSSLPETGQVVLERERVSGVPFYGPNQPLPEGRYKIALVFESPAEPGTELARLRQRFPLGADALDVPLVAGKACVFRYEHARNLLFGMELHFSRRADLTLNSVIIEREE